MCRRSGEKWREAIRRLGIRRGGNQRKKRGKSRLSFCWGGGKRLFFFFIGFFWSLGKRNKGVDEGIKEEDGKKKRERRGADALGNWEDICLLAHTRRVKKKNEFKEWNGNIKIISFSFISLWLYDQNKKKINVSSFLFLAHHQRVEIGDHSPPSKREKKNVLEKHFRFQFFLFFILI